jgi:hypothetical protein
MDKLHINRLNIVDLINALNLSPNDQKRRARTLATLILAEWSAEAKSSSMPSSVKQTYLKSLSIRQADENAVIVSLPKEGQSATLALMYELGMGAGGVGTSGPYDMRKFMLQDKTRNIRRDKKGRLYLNVPFKKSAKAVKAENPDIYKKAKKLSPTITFNAHSQHVNPQGAPAGSKGARLPRGLVPKKAPHHTTDIYAGMIRQASAYSNKQGKPVIQTSGYMTWRRMTMDQKPPKWMHPGINALNLARRVLDVVPQLVNEAYGD